MPILNPGEADYQYMSAASVLPAGVGDTFQQDFTVPDGFPVIDQIIFDPDKDISVKLLAPKLGNTNILNGLSTKIGSAIGMLEVGVRGIGGDTLKLSGIATAGVAANDTVTFTIRFSRG